MGKTLYASRLPFPAILGLCLLFQAAVPARAAEPAAGDPAWVEPGVDRPGSDFRILWLRGGPETCREACAQNPACQSYTYVRPGVPGRLEGCWLKDGVPPPVSDECCVSGVKSGEGVFRAAARRTRDGEGETAGLATVPEGRKERVREAGIPPADVPQAGSGARRALGLDFALAPSREPGASAGVPGVVPVPTAPEAGGTGRRASAGKDYRAIPPPKPSPGGSGSGAPAGPATGTGKRELGGAHYSASPSARRPAQPGGHGKPASAARTVTGVDLRATPPTR